MTWGRAMGGLRSPRSAISPLGRAVGVEIDPKLVQQSRENSW